MRKPYEHPAIPILVALVLLPISVGPPRVAVGQEAPPAAADTVTASEGAALQGPAYTETKPDEPFFASPYLPLGSWQYPILEYWVAAGLINSLSPIVKPWRRMDVARALADLDESKLGGGEKAWLGRLRESFVQELDLLAGPGVRNVRVSLQLGGGAELASQTHRDPLRPELEGEFSDAKLLEDIRVESDGAAGPVAGAFRLRRHGIYRNDAQYPDGRVVPKLDNVLGGEMSARVEEAYLEFQSRYARVGFGSMYRNWGLPDLGGFLRSAYAYSEEEISYRVGTDRIYLIGMFASYDDYGSDTTHYVAIHRLEIRPIDDLLVSVSESSIHGGPGQKLDWKLINPVSIWQIARTDGDPPYNKLGQLDVWWRTGLGFNLYGSLLADATNDNGSCCQMGGTLGFEVPRLAPGLLLRGNFSALQSLAYTPNNPDLPWEQYTVERIGIGWDKADLYLLSLEVEWFPRAGLWLRPKFDLQIRGSFDIRDDRPPGEELPTWPRILVGDAETTIRPALEGRWRNDWRIPFEVEWDVGVNFIQDYANVPGNNRTEFVGNIGVLLRTPRWSFGLK
jgi:hypothetical protein